MPSCEKLLDRNLQYYKSQWEIGNGSVILWGKGTNPLSKNHWIGIRWEPEGEKPQSNLEKDKELRSLGYYAASSGNFLPIDCPEKTSVRSYHYSLRNNSEERSSQLLAITHWGRTILEEAGKRSKIWSEVERLAGDSQMEMIQKSLMLLMEPKDIPLLLTDIRHEQYKRNVSYSSIRQPSNCKALCKWFHFPSTRTKRITKCMYRASLFLLQPTHAQIPGCW
jgi:hypothetical protein